MRCKKSLGFTLIEVLVALSILAIALTALLKTNGQAVVSTQRIKDKTISHWVAMQAVYMLQLGLFHIKENQVLQETTTMFNETWYWKAKILPTPVENMQAIALSLATNADGKYSENLLAFRYQNES